MKSGVGWGVYRLSADGSADEVYDEYASYLRKHVQLARPGEADVDNKHLAIAAAEFSRDGDTLFAELRRVGDYQTPWQKTEAEEELRNRANELRDEHPSSNVRRLADIQIARVTSESLDGPEGRLGDSHMGPPTTYDRLTPFCVVWCDNTGLGITKDASGG